jgi:hypothetical protein
MSRPASPESTAASRPASLLPLISIGVALLLAPLSLRAVNALVRPGENRSYLPSFETRPTRRGFRTPPLERLKAANPRWVFIGDSMLGTRIDPTLLGEISEKGDRRVELLMEAASGPAWGTWRSRITWSPAASGRAPRSSSSATPI